MSKNTCRHGVDVDEENCAACNPAAAIETLSEEVAEGLEGVHKLIKGLEARVQVLEHGPALLVVDPQLQKGTLALHRLLKSRGTLIVRDTLARLHHGHEGERLDAESLEAVWALVGALSQKT